jgi:hypothetical protein
MRGSGLGKSGCNTTGAKIPDFLLVKQQVPPGRSVEKHSADSELWVAGPGLLALYQGTTLVVP